LENQQVPTSAISFNFQPQGSFFSFFWFGHFGQNLTRVGGNRKVDRAEGDATQKKKMF
jgi:hypothetical protein